MQVSDAKLAEVWDRGFTVVENFVDPAALSAAQAALWTIFPTPEQYFADPSAFPQFSKSQTAGIQPFPFASWAINQLCIYPDLIDAAERLLKSSDIELYKAELWPKYSGAVNYNQTHHRDYRNHSLVVPREDGRDAQMTTFILLSDVTEADAPTKIVPVSHTGDVPLKTAFIKSGEYADVEVAIAAPAGSLLIYKTDVFHRASDFTEPNRARFAVLTDFQKRGAPWQGKMSWPDKGNDKYLAEALVKMTPRQRDLFGWPPVGSGYWNEQTLRDVQLRYSAMDLSPYKAEQADS